MKKKKTNLKCYSNSQYPISAIHILKAHGKSAMESHIVNGFALNCTRAAQGMPTTIEGAKVSFNKAILRVWE